MANPEEDHPPPRPRRESDDPVRGPPPEAFCQLRGIKEDEEVEDDDDDDGAGSGASAYEHGLRPADHVFRWTHVAFYPVQVHGIVLSAGPDMVTLADFGLTSAASSAADGPPSPPAAGAAAAAGGGAEEELERAEAAATKAVGGRRRLTVVTLVEEGDIKKWKKVDYGGDWEEGGDGDGDSADPGGKKGGRFKSLLSSFGRKTSSAEAVPVPAENIAAPADHDRTTTDAADTEEGSPAAETALKDVSAASRSAARGEPAADPKGRDDGERRPPKPPPLPKADPPGIVLSRVRYLLSHETTTAAAAGDNNKRSRHVNTALPPYHPLFANSECAAVWCKTGRFSTFQASVFLHSTAAGQAKSAATVAAVVSGQTVAVTTTVPAGGILGWFGATTTTTTAVPLLTAQPWLIPVLAGYGLAAVGTPYLILMRARSKWEAATRSLNDGFWGEAEGEAFVEAIRGWSGLR